jgi:capsular polysaccharide transport system ATP-binding protein
MIELINVTKFFRTKSGKKYILKDVTFTIPENKNIAILGRNGTGKSTFMRMLGNIEFPNSGKIVSNKTFSWPLGLNGGFVGSMSGRANVKFVARLYGKNPNQIRKVIKFVKEFSELGEYFEMPIKTYSSGMKGRLGFGLSLAFDFDYMLIDETLSVGDSKFRKKSKEALIQKIKKCNILLVSHDMKTVKELCESGIIVNNGQMHYFENVEDAVREYEAINKK